MSTNQSADTRIHSITQRFAAEISQIVRQSIADEVSRLLGAALHVGAPTAKHAATTHAKTTAAKSNFPSHCVYPGCANPQGGPRFSFLCPDHRNLSKADKKKYLANWKASHHKGGAATGTASAHSAKASAPKKAAGRKQHKMSAAGRKSLSEKMKARWAAKKKASEGKPAETSAPKKAKKAAKAGKKAAAAT